MITKAAQIRKARLHSPQRLSLRASVAPQTSRGRGYVSFSHKQQILSRSCPAQSSSTLLLSTPSLNITYTVAHSLSQTRVARPLSQQQKQTRSFSITRSLFINSVKSKSHSSSTIPQNKNSLSSALCTSDSFSSSYNLPTISHHVDTCRFNPHHRKFSLFRSPNSPFSVSPHHLSDHSHQSQQRPFTSLQKNHHNHLSFSSPLHSSGLRFQFRQQVQPPFLAVSFASTASALKPLQIPISLTLLILLLLVLTVVFTTNQTRATRPYRIAWASVNSDPRVHALLGIADFQEFPENPTFVHLREPYWVKTKRGDNKVCMGFWIGGPARDGWVRFCCEKQDGDVVVSICQVEAEVKGEKVKVVIA